MHIFIISIKVKTKTTMHEIKIKTIWKNSESIVFVDLFTYEAEIETSLNLAFLKHVFEMLKSLDKQRNKTFPYF
jgi:hypothetical protein